MLYPGFQNKREFPDVNKELAKLEGYLDNDVAKETLVQYLRHNLGITTQILTGKQPFPFQEMMVRAMFNKDFFLTIAGRGLSKSWTTALFCWLYALFNPGVKIGIVSGSFRQARVVFEYIEEFVNSKGGILLHQSLVGEPSHKNDAWTMNIGKSKIAALPLGIGQKLRGFRFNVMVIDELMLVPENIINEVILPFLAVNSNPVLRKEVYDNETGMIRRGEITEEERTKFKNNKFIGLSSASYKFEFLYRLYKEYVDKIYDTDARDEDGKPMDTTGYGVLQFSYKVAPNQFYDDTSIAKFRAQMSEVQFNREFNSIFTDDSGGFFSKKKMDACTIDNGKEPTIEIVGDPAGSYILSIDPSWSKSEASDHFSMCLAKIDYKTKEILLVHNYAVAGGAFQDHLNYLAYLLTHFNIVYTIIDASGSWFIEDANASTTFASNKLKLDFFDADFDNLNYAEALRKAKMTFKPGDKKICHAQWFSPDWLMKSNERLSACFDHRTVKFAARAIDTNYERLMKLELPIEHLVYDLGSKSLKGPAKKGDFIEHQAEMIDLVKAETALIEVSTSDTGMLRFTLPQNVKRDKSPIRTRRDSYTTLLMASWAAKCYFDMLDEPVRKFTIVPSFV